MKKIISFLLVVLFGNTYAQTQWTQTSTPPGGSIWALATIGNDIFAGASNGGVFISSDQGATWIQRNGAYPGIEVYALCSYGTDLYAGTGGAFGGHIFKSSNLGISLTEITPTIMSTSSNVRSIVTDGTSIFAGTYGANGIYKSSLAGVSTTSWSTYNTGLVNQNVSALEIFGTTIYAGTYGDGVNISSTTVASWSSTSGMPAFSDYIRAVDVNDTTVFAGNVSGLPVLFRSTDSGLNWATSSTSIFNDMPVYAIFHIGNTIYVGTEGEGVISSADNGATWSAYNNGFKDSFGNWYCVQINVRSLDTLGTTLFAGTDCGVWKISTLTGINDLSIENSFSLYPNPATESINIKIENELLDETYIISDMLGRVLVSGKTSLNTTTISISELNPGMYIFSFKNNTRRKIKFLKY